MVKNFNQLAKAGMANYEEANKVAREIGNILARAYENNLSSAILPDGKMYYNIAQRVIRETLEIDYNIVANIAEAAQNNLNQAANIGIKAIRPELNQDRVDGIINRVSSADYFDDVKWILGAPVSAFTQSIVDDAIKENVDFHGKSGLKPKIVRKSSGHCCDWCNKVAGTYVYPDVPKDVFRRHDNCDCVVEYFPEKGKRQDVWSKQWKYEKESDKIKERKTTGIKGLPERLIEHPKMLQSYTPESLKEALEKEGYNVKPLGKGKLKGILFEEGGGYRISFNGDEYLQYHPEKFSHHGGAYYKAGSGLYGKHRYDLKGDEIFGKSKKQD